MTNLFRRASYLFWQYPILWVPIFAADILDTLLKEVRPLITHALIQCVLQSHSVLSSVPDPLQASQQSTWKAAFLSAPIVWGSHFVGIVLYASAMTMTATLVLMNSPTIRGLYKQNLDYSFKDTLLFSLKSLRDYFSNWSSMDSHRRPGINKVPTFTVHLGRWFRHPF
jgi:hypothetical protein